MCIVITLEKNEENASVFDILRVLISFSSLIQKRFVAPLESLAEWARTVIHAFSFSTKPQMSILFYSDLFNGRKRTLKSGNLPTLGRRKQALEFCNCCFPHVET